MIIEKFEAVIDKQLGGEDRTLVDTGEKRIWARKFTDGGDETTFIAIAIGFPNGHNTLSIKVTAHEDGTEDLAVSTGLIQAQRFDTIDMFSWSTANEGWYLGKGGSIGVSRKDKGEFGRMAKEGFPQYSRESELPGHIDVEKAVGYWLDKIDDCCKNPEELDALDLSIANTVGQFSLSEYS